MKLVFIKSIVKLLAKAKRAYPIITQPNHPPIKLPVPLNSL